MSKYDCHDHTNAVATLLLVDPVLNRQLRKVMHS
jgi:hypothetical protein